jgi:putative membrane protein
MKQVQNIVVLFLSFLIVQSCEPSRKPDSHEIAEEKNEKNFDTRADEKEAEFVAEAIQSNYAEIRLAELASTKSSNKQVQATAQELVSDHTNALAKLQALANKKGISTPVDEGEDGKKRVNKLAKVDQPDFDKKWCDELVDNHEKTIRDFESMQEKSKDPELKEFISATLPKLREHRDKLTSLEKDMM